MTKDTLPESLFDYLTTVAAEAGQSPDELILAAIEQHLEDVSDLRAIAEYEKQRADGTLKTISLEELSAKLGLDD